MAHCHTLVMLLLMPKSTILTLAPQMTTNSLSHQHVQGYVRTLAHLPSCPHQACWHLVPFISCEGFTETIFTHNHEWRGQSEGRGQPIIFHEWKPSVSHLSSSLRLSLFLRVWPLVSLKNNLLTMSNYQLYRHVTILRGIQFRPWFGIPATYQIGEGAVHTCLCTHTDT